jgi:quercetin dioxygenase-like cupin family protein
MTHPINIPGGQFFEGSSAAWEDIGGGIRRKILSYAAETMLVQVAFKAGAIGLEHKHPHLQTTFVAKGLFDVTISGVTRRLREGDSFFVPTNQLHSVIAIEAGMLIDSFTPMREDFV